VGIILTTQPIVAGCGVPAVDCGVAWPDVTSSIRRPVSVDDSGRLSPGWRSSGTRDNRGRGRDNATSPVRAPGLRDGATSLPPCSDHVTSLSRQPFPVGDDEDATRSSGTTSSADRRRRINSSGSSRPRDDVTDPEPPPTASFPRLGHVTGSDFAAWCPALWRAFAAALRRRVAPLVGRPDDAGPPLFGGVPQWDLGRRMTADDAAEQVRSAAPDRGGVPLLSPWPPSYLQRRVPVDEPPPPRVMWSADSTVDDRRLPAGDVPSSHVRSATTLASHVGGLNASLVTSLPDHPPRNFLTHRPPPTATSLPPRQHPYHYTHAGRQQSHEICIY